MYAALTAFFEMLKQAFSLKQTDLENKTTLDVVDDKESLKKGTDIAEEIFKITDKYTRYFENKDLKKYNSLKKKFNKNN